MSVVRVTCAFAFDQSRQPEIGKMRFAFRIEQNIPWLDVAMQNAVLVGVMHGPRQLRDQFCGTPDRNRLFPRDLVELAAFDQIHAEVAITVALADFVNRDDEWMVQAGGCLSFETKAFQMCFGRPSTDANDF